MLIFNHLRARIVVNDKREIFGVRSAIEVPITPRSGIGCTLPLPGYSSGLT